MGTRAGHLGQKDALEYPQVTPSLWTLSSVACASAEQSWGWSLGGVVRDRMCAEWGVVVVVDENIKYANEKGRDSTRCRFALSSGKRTLVDRIPSYH